MTASLPWRLVAILTLHTLLFLPSGALAAQDEETEESEDTEEGSETASEDQDATEELSPAAEAAAPEAPAEDDCADCAAGKECANCSGDGAPEEDDCADCAAGKDCADCDGEKSGSSSDCDGSSSCDRPAKTKTKPKISDFMKTSLTFYLGDDNVLAGNADRSPNFGMGNEYPELFFEGLNSEKQKVVSETHMVVYAQMPGFLPFVDTEAAFVAEFELSRDPDNKQLIGRFRDDGSYVAITFWFNRNKRGANLKLTAWPYSANRFRLGYTYDLTWGGNTIWARNGGPVPGAKLHLDLKNFYAFIGAKSLPQLRADNNEVENYWGVLAGLGPNFSFGPADSLQFNYDVSGGYFSRGTFQQDPFRAVALQAFGVSQRVQLTKDTRMGLSPDVSLLVNDPEKRRQVTGVPNYKGNWGFGVGAEFTTLWQTLIDANDPSQAALDNAITAGVFAQGRFFRNLRVGLDVVYRDVSFLVFNVPGLTPYLSFVEDTIRTPQIYGALWADYYFEKAKITPGIVVGLMQPASFAAATDATGQRKLQVIREANDYELMPDGTEKGFTVLSVKGSVKWHLSPIVAMIGEVSYIQDFNVSRVVTNSDTGVGERVLDDAMAQRLGLNLLIQASF